MKTKSFLEELQKAKKESYAVGAFNIFNYLSAKAVIRAAEKLNTPLILQTSVSTVKEFGPLELAGMLRQLAWNASVNVVIHLDHCQSVDLAKACIDAGWDAVMFDGSRLPFAENVALTREVVEYAHKRRVDVEGELGKIVGTEDNVHVEEADAMLASLDESIQFVKESGVDAFAPAVGTAHGVYKGTPVINFTLVEQLKTAVDAPVVVHGGTGLSVETFHRLIHGGGAKVNVSTALKHAYIDGSKEYAEKYPDKVNPIHFDRFLFEKIEATAAGHMEIFKGGE